MSVTDIDNQANYQQLFQGDSLRDDCPPPFVGLIVGTYAQSVRQIVKIEVFVD